MGRYDANAAGARLTGVPAYSKQAPAERTGLTRHAAARLIALGALALASLPLYARIGAITQAGTVLLLPAMALTLIAVVACWMVLGSRPAASQRVRWLELALIALAGVAFRALFLGTPPALSQDAYRYVWDAHLVAHGVSPYTHIVTDPALAALRDSVIWPRVSWRGSPTLYPPGAQLAFLLVHWLAPLNITAMQLFMALCDLLCGALTVVLLRQRGLDPRRAIVYWWSPLPVLEFTASAHVDALATLWVLAALAVAGTRWRLARPVAGVLLGLAVMTKLYPLLFAVALVRRRDWGFVLALGATCLALAAPFVPLGLGGGGFLGTYFAQRFGDQGLAFRLITTVFVNGHIQLALQVLGLLAACALVASLRLRRGLPPAAAILVLSAGWIVFAPHLFPWYVGLLLPLLALSLRLPAFPAPGRHVIASHHAMRALPAMRGLAPEDALALWLFVLLMPFTYVIFAPGQRQGLFLLFFLVPLALAAYPRLARRLRTANAGALIAARPLPSKE
ncbi:MAG: glycosyltransferase 87 family protein [Ktedonobacterales bacterium]